MPANRREFLGAAALAASAAAGAEPLSEVITVAVIGNGGMGTNHAKLLSVRKDVRIAYVCDPDSTRSASASKLVESIAGNAPKPVADLRTVLDDKSVQAVWVATPDHWHGPAAILAADAGKHVYVEKPCAHNVREGRLLIDAARRNKIVMQVGTQSRSTDHVRAAIDAIRSGVIGEVRVAKAWNSQLRKNIGHAQPSEAPANLNYDLWVGPAPMVPFQANRAHYTWHWWHDFGTGDMGNDGVHELDIARWGLGATTLPTRVSAFGGKFHFDDDQQFPDTHYAVFEWPGDGKVGSQRQLVYEQRIWSPYFQEDHENGNAFYGTKGVLILGKETGWKVILAGNKPGPQGPGGVSVPNHHGNFLDCIRKGGTPNGDIAEGHLSAALCHLGNIAVRTGRPFNVDAVNERISGDAEADAMLRRRYREGHWAVPKG